MRPIYANLCGAGVAGGVLALGLLLGGEAEADAPARAATLAAPERLVEGTGEVPLGESMEIWGRPSRLSIFWTQDSREEVLRVYSEAWSSAGLKPTVKVIDQVSSVSAIDPETGLMRSVSVLEAGEERIVMPALVDVRALPDVTARGAPVPIPENARAYLAQVADDAVSVSYNAHFLVPLTPGRAVEFYERELGQLGYQPATDGLMNGLAPGSAGGEFSRGPEWVSVVASNTDDHEGRASFVVVTHTRKVEQGPVEEERE